MDLYLEILEERVKILLTGGGVTQERLVDELIEPAIQIC